MADARPSGRAQHGNGRSASAANSRRGAPALYGQPVPDGEQFALAATPTGPTVSAIPKLVESAFTGRPGLILLLGRDRDDVDSVVGTVVRPALKARGLADDDILEVQGLAWEHRQPYGILGRLGLGPDTTVAQTVAHLQDLARQRSRAIIINEASDADPESIHALSSAVLRLTDEPILVVVAAPKDAVLLAGDDAPLAELHRAHRRTTCLVDALDPAGVRDHAARLGVPLDEGAARRLWQHTEGSPGQIAELLTSFDPQTWKSPDSPIPPTPSALRRLTRLLDQVDPEVARLVEACATMGRWASIEELITVADVADPVRFLDRAVSAGLLRVRRVGMRLRVGFPSRMIRAAAYEAMGVARQREMHLRAAKLLDDYDTSLFQRARAAGVADADLASKLEAHAGGAATEGRWDRAGEAWLAASRLSVDKADRARRMTNSVDAKVSAGNLFNAASLLPELEGTSATPARESVLGHYQLLQGHRDEADVLLRRAWAGIEGAAGRAVVAHRLALHSLFDWDSASVVEWCERAMTEDPGSSAAIEAETMYMLGVGGLGRSEDALRAAADVTGRMTTGAQGQRALMGQGWLHLALDQVPLAAHELAMAAPTAAWRGSWRISLWADGWLARARLAMGDLRAAQAAVDQAVPLLDATGQNALRPLVHWAGAELAALRGDFDLAERHATLATSVRTDYQGMLVAATMARAVVGLARGDHAGVVRAFGPLVSRELHPAINEPGFWPWQDSYALALVATGAVAEADAFLRPHEALAAEREHRSSMARLGSVRGRIRIGSGDLDGGRAAFEQALGIISDLPFPLLEAQTRLAYGQSLRRAGKRRDAETELDRARRAYAGIGATGCVAMCDRELKAGARTRDVSVLSQLTPQEQAVVRLVVQGLTYREVAANLFISVKTVQYHLTRVYARLGVRSRSELAALRLEL